MFVVVACTSAVAVRATADSCVEKSQAATATSKSESDTGKALFKKARSLQQAGKNVEACKMFESSILLDPQIGTRLNVAACREQAGDLIAARMAFEEVAEEAARTNDPRGDFAKERQQALAAQLVRITVNVKETDTQGISMRVGECPVTPVPASTTRFVRPGKVAVDVSAPGRMSFHKVHDGVAGKDLVVNVPALAPEVDPEAEKRAKEAEARAAADRKRAEEATVKLRVANHHPARKWAIIGGAVGAAAMIAGGVFGYMARSAEEDFDAQGCGDRTRLLDPDAYRACKDLGDTGQRNALLANSLLIGGGVTLAISAVVFVLDPGHRAQPEQAQRRATVLVSPRGVGVSWVW